MEGDWLKGRLAKVGSLLLVGADVFDVTVLDGLLPDEKLEFAWKGQKVNEWW